MVLLADVGQVEACFGQFRNSVNLSARWKLIWKLISMVLLADVCHVEAYFYLFGDCVNLESQFALNVPRAWKSFQARLIVLLGDIGQVEARLGPFGVVLILTEDRCAVCVECTTSMEIFSGTPDGTSR
jgi:hypothetical protein